MSTTELRARLSDLSGVDADAIGSELLRQRRAEADALDPVGDPLALPEDRRVWSLADLLSALDSAGASADGRVDVTGLRGGALSYAVAAVARARREPIVLVTADLERARTLVADLEPLIGRPKRAVKPGAKAKPTASNADDEADVSAEDAEDEALGQVLLFAAPESSPYAEIAPDRRAALGRLATLSHLARAGRDEDASFRVLVITAAALVRRVVPRKVIESRTERIVAEDELDREAMLARLTEAGYLRVPVVEDPGTFAVRGALLDVWSPSAAQPVRVELYGELVLSIKRFDPDKQRTTATLASLVLPPAREAIVDDETSARAKEAVSNAADAVNYPTSKARQLAEDVVAARGFFGAEGWLPAYYDRLDPIFRYLPDDARFVLDDPAAIATAMRQELAATRAELADKQSVPHLPHGAHYVDEADVAAAIAGHPTLVVHKLVVEGDANAGEEGDAFAPYLSPPRSTESEVPTLASRDLGDLAQAVKLARAGGGHRSALDPLVRRIAVWREHGLRTFITARTQTQAERLVALLRGQDVATRARIGPFDPAWLDDASFGRDEVEVAVASLAEGALLPTERLVFVTEEEVFGARGKRRAARGASKGGKDAARPFIEDLRALSVGDLVVHAEHGVGRYMGLEHRDILGPATYDADGKLHQEKTRIDLLVVEYGGADRLYLPVHRLHQIQKYSGGEAATTRLDKLGGSTFAKTKQKVERAVKQMADELLRLYAERQAVMADPLPAITDDYREFEATFPFEETPDQAKAIEDVIADLSSERPMDRLVCGDVGFGKTEVAIRAAFRAAIAGKQVAVLCPTTVLAQQHYLSFKNRFEGYPIVVAPMSRFQDGSEQSETLRRLKEGKIDVVVGTHRLLSKDVHFKDLGLLVIDEEQRFGVTHKERIKQLRTKIHALTLTATPIPRTLQMAVSGLRDLSLITTAPVDRRAIRTVVTRMDDHVIRDAIARELSRGGQVFYVHNRVGLSDGGGIYEKAQKINQLLPHARVGVAHGQMGEKALEQAMLDFVEGRFDVLCATAIVESGLDIPRANTIIIDRADMFGLAQLYQLRGRVGRSKERAYCYLIVPPDGAMTDEARMRIDALEKHTELGAGFKIASLDLEIRGAGDLLGGEQSGNVASVGFEMFCQMLDEAVHRLRGDVLAAAPDIDPELSFDVEAYLPDDYIADVGVRLSLYKRLAQAQTDDDVTELAAEMEDRFGPPPATAAHFVRLMRLKCELRELRALGCEATRERVTLHLRTDTPLDPQKLLKVVAKRGSPWKLSPDMRLTRRLEPGVAGDGIEAAERVCNELVDFRKEAGVS
jgi:transcription-repair coupling factor (superfamily II helicase)